MIKLSGIYRESFENETGYKVPSFYAVKVEGDIEAQFDFSADDMRAGLSSQMFLATSNGALIKASTDYGKVKFEILSGVNKSPEKDSIVFDVVPAWILAAPESHILDESLLATKESSEHTFIGPHKIEIKERRGEYTLINREFDLNIHCENLWEGMKEMEKKLKEAEA